MDKRSWWVLAIAAVAATCLVVAAVVVVADDDDEGASDVPGSSTTAVTSPTTAISVTTTTGPATTSSTAAPTTTTPTTTSPTSSTSAPASSTTTADQGPVPAIVEVVNAGSGGGSGEVVLDWGAVPGATTYQVLRSDDEDGTFEIVAEIDVVMGTASAADDVVNVWSPQHSYVPSDGALATGDTSATFQYVELAAGRHCFRVVASNTAGDGPASLVTCGSPP
jgi:hypothetical protein